MDVQAILEDLKKDPEAAKAAKALQERIDESEVGDADFLADFVEKHLADQDEEETEESGAEQQEEENPPPEDEEAEDLAPGQLSSTEMAKFKAMPLSQQNALIEAIKKARYWQDKDPVKAREYQAKLDKLTGDAGLEFAMDGGAYSFGYGFAFFFERI